MFNKPLVTPDWLYKNLENKNLIILDATISKVTAKEEYITDKSQVKGAVFFDIKNTFSDVKAPFPNTALQPKEFEIKAQKLGINNNSILVVYDDLGIYSSARAWWLFQLMGFKNVAVLDGGLPAWKAKDYLTEKPTKTKHKKGNFIANYNSEKIKFTQDLLASINSLTTVIADARSKERFFGTTPEPRKEVKSGHITNSLSLPFTELLEKGKMKSVEELKTIFSELKITNKELIFSCGTGITACILALGAQISGIENYAVYDGSWTEWGSTNNLPISI
jgi:thiosulfate/3-mercaptopyruvate sulfurtransferase